MTIEVSGQSDVTQPLAYRAVFKKWGFMLVHVTSHAGIVHFLAGFVAGMVFDWILVKVRPDDA